MQKQQYQEAEKIKYQIGFTLTGDKGHIIMEGYFTSIEEARQAAEAKIKDNSDVYEMGVYTDEEHESELVEGIEVNDD